MRERDQNDAAPWYGHEEANAWASGFNDCAQNHAEPMRAMLERVMAVPAAAAAIEAAGFAADVRTILEKAQ